jgi:hypothetical protein
MVIGQSSYYLMKRKKIRKKVRKKREMIRMKLEMKMVKKNLMVVTMSPIFIPS